MAFKAKVQTWVGASWPDFLKLVDWLSLAQSPAKIDNPNLQFATVTDERNEIVGCVPFERVFIVSADEVAQTTAPSNDLPAGNAAAGAIERAAQEQGVGKVLMILAAHHPTFPGEKWVRVVEQPVAQPTTQIRIGSDSPNRTFLN